MFAGIEVVVTKLEEEKFLLRIRKAIGWLH